MKKKFIIIAVVAVALVLGGTLAYAAVDEEGNFVNPFSNLLSKKVEEGTITEAEAAAFNKVWEEIRGDMDSEDGFKKMPGGRMTPDGKRNPGEWPQMNSEVMTALREAVEARTDEILAGLVEDGILDESVLDEDGMGYRSYLKDADDETIAAVKEAFAELGTYKEAVIDDLVEDGTITEEEAENLKNPKKMIPGGKRGSKGSMRKTEDEEDPNT